MIEQEMAALLDRDAIRRIQENYFRGTDRHDAALVGSCFWPDATLAFGAWQGKPSEFFNFSSPFLKSLYINTHHMLGQCTVRLDGDAAGSETYCIAAHHRADGEDGAISVDTIWCRYADRLQRRGGEWRITSRQFIVDQIQRVTASDRGGMDLAAYVGGRQGADDASYAVLR